MKLENRVAVVTGATSGIGNAIARRLASDGANLAVTEHRSSADELKRDVEAMGRKILSMKTDMRSTSDVNLLVKTALDTFGHIDILCSVAGTLSWGRVEDITDDEWDNLVDSDLKGTFRLVRAVLPAMKRQGYGRIILTSSIEGKVIGWPGRVHYCAAKGGIDSMVRALALEVAKSGITVNAIAPGPVDTNMIKSKASLGEVATRNFARFVPVGYVGEPEDVAGLVSYLASKESRFLTGQSIVIDGGYSIGVESLSIPGENPPPPAGKVVRRED